MDKTGIYRSPAMVTVDVFLVSLVVGAERVRVFFYTHACVMNIRVNSSDCVSVSRIFPHYLLSYS